jgi:hypothetical protein
MSVANKSGNSRRRFLQSAAVVGAGLTTAWPEIAAGMQSPSTRSGVREDVGDAKSRSHHEEKSGGRPDEAEIAAAVERSLTAILADGIDPNFPTPFELDRLKDDIRLRREVADLTIEYMVHPAKRSEATVSLHLMSMPKTNMFGYRYFTQIDVLGALRYLATAILISNRIEAAKKPDTEQRVFSFRFLRDGPAIFDYNCHYGAFLERTLEKLDARGKTFLVSADIANFYPSIDDARFIRGLGAHGVEPWLAETLEDILSQWKPGWRRGFPVAPFASNLLAEAALANVDEKLANDAIDFVRYIDDYRLFAHDLAAARSAVGRLVEHLQVENLTLNQAKTSVEDVTSSEYLANLNERRMLRFWNQPPPQVPDQVVQDTTVQPPKSLPPEKRGLPAPKRTARAGRSARLAADTMGAHRSRSHNWMNWIWRCWVGSTRLRSFHDSRQRRRKEN